MNNEIKLNFKYSVELEAERVRNTLDKLDWFLKNHYKTESLIFPKDVSVGDSKDEILEKVKKEFDINKYKDVEESLKKLFDLYKSRLLSFVREIDSTPINDVNVILTKYGIAGSYNVPNTVIVNFSKFFNIGLLRILLHEIIHLHIQHLIDLYKISQWQKEIIVDSLFEKAFPDLVKKQDYPIDVSATKKIFDKYYPNLEAVVDNVSKERGVQT